MAKPKKRVVISKAGGNDAYSWAVFTDGRMKYNGCTLADARYYQRSEREKIGCD